MKKEPKTKKEEVHEAILDLRKKYGENVITLAEDGYPPVEAISTNCFAIDNVIGVGGIPRGRIIELFGNPSSGKSSCCLYIISELQKQGKTCAYIDAEYAFNSEFASSIGVDIKKLLVSQPSTLEEAGDTIRALVATNQIDLIVVDSVAAMVPKKEVDGEEMLGTSSFAVQAQLMSKMLRILTGEIARSKTCVIFVNHLKEKMGLVFGEKTTTPGGKSLKFFASVRLAVSTKEKIKAKDDSQIGSLIQLTAQKNKVSPPWRKGEFTLYYATGVDKEADVFDTGVEHEVIAKTGNTYEFEGKKIGVGREQGIATLKTDQELHQKIREAIIEKNKKQ